MGVAKTARETANSGQFSATFYGLFRNLTFLAISCSGALQSVFSGKVRKVGSRPIPGGGSVGGREGGLGQLPRSCSRLLQTGPQTEASVWSLPPTQTHLAQVRVAKLASLLKSPQPVMACHDRLGWVEQTCQASQQVEVVRWGEVVRLGCQGEVSS